MAISVGDQLPDINLFVMSDEGPAGQSLVQFAAGRKVVIFGVPGAFTPTCHANHAPGFVANAEAFKAKGVDEIACVAVNDIFVLDAWSKDLGAKGIVTMLADGNGELASALGLELDASAFGLGVRSHRFAMFVDNGVVQHVIVEDVPTSAEATSAEALLAAI